VTLAILLPGCQSGIYSHRKPWILRLATAKSNTAQASAALTPYSWLRLSKSMAAYGGGFGVYCKAKLANTAKDVKRNKVQSPEA